MAKKVLRWCHATLRNTSLTCCEENFAVDDEGWLDPQPSEKAIESLSRIPGFSQKARVQESDPAPASEASGEGDDISSPPAPKPKKAPAKKAPAKKASSDGGDEKSSPAKKAPAKPAAKSTKTQAAAKKSAAKNKK